MTPFFWIISYLAILFIDSAVLISVLLEIDWPWLNFLDTPNGRLFFGGVLGILTAAIVKCVAISRQRSHLLSALVLLFFTSLIFILWGVFGHLNSLPDYALLASKEGKWFFTILCTLFFIPWLWGFQGETHSMANAFHFHIFGEEHGRLYGFLYAWSGAAYLMIKIYVLIGVALYVLIFLEWDSFFSAQGLVSQYLTDQD